MDKKEPKNRIGERYGKLTILEWKKEGKYNYYYCRCSCGTKKWMRSDTVIGRENPSCGCSRQKDLTNKRFGMLVAKTKSDRRVRNGCVWICECDCGNTIEVLASDLTNKRKKNCGCQKLTNWEKSAENSRQINKNKNLRDGTSLARINRGKLNSNNTSGVTGVYYSNNVGKWYAQIKFKGQTKYLGMFKTREEAATARKEAEEKYFKPFLDEHKK